MIPRKIEDIDIAVKRGVLLNVETLKNDFVKFQDAIKEVEGVD